MPASRRVLVIEDDGPTRLVATAHLEERGHEVLVATEAEDGLRRARGDQPAVIVLAATLAGGEGWALLEELDADPATAPVPVVMLVAGHEASAAGPGRGGAWSVGADAHLVKPFSPDELSGLVAAVLENERAAGE